MKMWISVLFLFGVVGTIMGHSYHLGACPNVEPMLGFEMNKFLGVWYVIQKTSTGSSCITYNFTRTDEPDEYEIEQVSQHFALSYTPLDHDYKYKGRLTVADTAIPARMTVKFPLSVAGTASYTVMMTDYETYAGIFTCQKLAFAHRQSATILSRSKTLDKAYVDKIRSRLSSYNVDPFELSIISQKDCPKDGHDGVNINIDDGTFTAGSVAGVVRKAGEKLGDGIEYVAGGAKKLYNNLSHQTEDTTARNSKAEAERLTVNPNAEWLP